MFVSPWWLSSKESACQCRRPRFDPWVGRISWRRKWQPTPVFLPGKPHEQRSLVSYSPWGRKRVRHDLATTQQQSPQLNQSKTTYPDFYILVSMDPNPSLPISNRPVHHRVNPRTLLLSQNSLLQKSLTASLHTEQPHSLHLEHNLPCSVSPVFALL